MEAMQVQRLTGTLSMVVGDGSASEDVCFFAHGFGPVDTPWVALRLLTGTAAPPMTLGMTLLREDAEKLILEHATSFRETRNARQH